MKKLYPTFKYFAISIILICIVLNWILCYNEGNLKAIFALRNLYLYGFLTCYLFYDRLTIALLALTALVFWYQYFTVHDGINFSENPIIYFTFPLREVVKFYVPRIVVGLVLITPLFLFTVITVVEIPYRIRSEIKKKPAAKQQLS
jgi:hypothetical protein